MKFHVLSDLHLHFGDMNIPETDADCVLIAGDLHDGYRSIGWLKEQKARIDKPFYVVLGNHEYYGKVYEWVYSHWIEQLKGLDITILDAEHNPYVILSDDILLMGDTLWTDFHKDDPLSRAICNYSMSDFSRIKTMKSDTYRRFTAEDSYVRHKKTLEVFRECRDTFWNMKLVVMTHHAPSYKSIAPAYIDSKELNGAFCSDLIDVMDELRVSLWVHGHTHNQFDYIAGMNTRVVCNPRGISQFEDTSLFNMFKVVEI